ncbi:hypothetical protein [Robertkochia solimangrovi]|uniref:hypothetical protein n=1 Tax=Robertkochia solimangrovi TaxID=2213046 RepID=UPI00117D1F5E|nr:hypothetical protein [Robertkochia solimangrovi]TRZ43183.1 hypothetical protein DMZ48_10850 [Robertkochia solimangrovi]
MKRILPALCIISLLILACKKETKTETEPDTAKQTSIIEDTPDKLVNFDIAFKLKVRNDGKVLVDQFNVSPDQFKKRIRKYLITYKQESAFVIEAGEDTDTKMIDEVKHTISNEILSMREQLSEKKYYRTYSDLNEREQNTVNEAYPNIVFVNPGS